ncbi:MAG: type I-E CRISPR-associated protein Cse1/CasA [Salinisphaeraceae bacterium]|nr:type I-E CRISPR-associated protein Cse1/CasA [Salinisphaeraceae bacterium]
MNLLTNNWIPVRTRSGQHKWIAPWQITEGLKDDPIIAVDAPRADFTGALQQFLIALLQTAFAPERESNWKTTFSDPPEPAALKAAFSEFAAAFNFGPDRPSFMEDLELEGKSDKPIAGLLIEAPGGNTLKENKDVFVKRGQVNGICPEVAAMALLALQVNAPSGGVGHRTSLRGGGPLTTLMMNAPGSEKDTLWHNLWLNVLTAKSFNGLSGQASLNKSEQIFPWLAPCRVSDKTGDPTTPEDAHPLVMYWAMPRRIRLDWNNTQAGVCDVTGRECESLLTGYTTKNYGANYEGAWLHPLSPYHESDKGPMPFHPQPGGLPFRYWLGFTGYRENLSRPAAVVSQWQQRRDQFSSVAGVPHIWAFGFDMDNMQARCWYEALMPLHYVQQNPERFAERIQALIESADQVGRVLRAALKQSWFKRPGDAKGDVSFITDSFWQTMEGDFYAHMRRLVAVLDGEHDSEAAEDHALSDITVSWHVALKSRAIKLFDQWASAGYFEAEDPRRIATAHNDLQKNLNGPKLRKLLGLGTSRKAA